MKDWPSALSVTVNGCNGLLISCRPDKTVTSSSGNVPGGTLFTGPVRFFPVSLTSSQALLYAFFYLL
ncbi:hypothetical protein E5284_21520 [Citrobacter freundii]|nr:hypothetical protein E5284_21520 [Citrobacter freundii]